MAAFKNAGTAEYIHAHQDIVTRGDGMWLKLSSAEVRSLHVAGCCSGDYGRRRSRASVWRGNSPAQRDVPARRRLHRVACSCAPEVHFFVFGGPCQRCQRKSTQPEKTPTLHPKSEGGQVYDVTSAKLLYANHIINSTKVLH